ncbi:MAG: MBL fold metallo-hydrolase [Eubacteriales bacterium]|nr:MBL fold metallo-hydrolase [Eubacteriales bacterium]
MNKTTSRICALALLVAALCTTGCARHDEGAIPMYTAHPFTPLNTAQATPEQPHEQTQGGGVLTPKPQNTEATERNTGQLDAQIHFIPVGQADAILIMCDGESMLIDAGNEKDGETIVRYLRDRKVRELKYVVATHPHADHIGGMSVVLHNYRPALMIMPDVAYESAAYERVDRAISSMQLDVDYTEIGKRYTLGHATITIIAPAQRTYEDINAYSVGLRVDLGDRSMITCGDATAASEYEMLLRGNLNADILKVSHHGSDSSTTAPFLLAVSPQYAVVTCDEAASEDALPNKDVLRKLELAGAEVLRTDKEGCIVFRCDGRTITRERIGG